MPEGVVNAGQQAGVQLGDILYQINGTVLHFAHCFEFLCLVRYDAVVHACVGETPATFNEFIAKIKETRGAVTLTLLRRRG